MADLKRHFAYSKNTGKYINYRSHEKAEEWLGAIMFLFVCMIILVVVGIARNVFFFQVNVNGESMIPTFNNEDIVFVDRHSAPKRGDVVIVNALAANHPFATEDNKFWIKRIIGLPGEKVEFEKGVEGYLNVYITLPNGNRFLLEEDYIKEKMTYLSPAYTTGTTPAYWSIQLGSGELFVCGDNRNGSADSRPPRDEEQWRGGIKFVIKDTLLGKVWLTIPKGSFWHSIFKSFGNQDAGSVEMIVIKKPLLRNGSLRLFFVPAINIANDNSYVIKNSATPIPLRRFFVPALLH